MLCSFPQLYQCQTPGCFATYDTDYTGEKKRGEKTEPTTEYNPSPSTAKKEPEVQTWGKTMLLLFCFFFTLTHFCTYNKSMLNSLSIVKYMYTILPPPPPQSKKTNKNEETIYTHTLTMFITALRTTSVSQFRPFGAWYTVNLH